MIYTFDTSDPVKQSRAVQLVRDAIRTGEGRVSAQVIHEFVNVALRKFARPLTPGECTEYVESLLLPMCRVPWTQAMTLDALGLVSRHSLSWFDSLIVAGARASECTTLWSEDMKDGSEYGRVRVRNPFAPSATAG
ncbi:MAG: PIN domain-containing protein [Myxococcales bacterium]|nr:PIN domain-containing protein [Myxococcales bacterium]